MAEQRKINKEVHVTGFSGKHITDLDYTFNIDEKVNFPANCHTESMGFRFINKDGQGFIAVIIEGNEETFQLTSGFIPLGSVTQNGILYIISHNPTTTAGEIGCYPSPITAAGGFERVYKPLYNLDIGNAFRSKSFTLNLLYQCSVIAKDSYDGTVDLYICDYFYGNRVINNGFDRNGVAVVERHYTTAQLSSMIYHIPHTPSATRISGIGLTNGGNLKCGNIFFFVRYLTNTLDPTHFVVHTNACQIDDGNRIVFNTDGGYTNGGKIATINLLGVDTTYSFIEVAYVRYYSDPNGVVNRESYLINKKYEITGAAMTIEVTGFEGDIIISDVDTLLQKNPFDISRDHVIIDNRYWGNNWKQNAKHRDCFAEFARRICVTWQTETINAAPVDPNALLVAQGQYKLYEYTYDKVGHFRTEAYPYGIVFEFTDGSETAVYPLRGNDALGKTYAQLIADYIAGTDDNETGAFRFPAHGDDLPNTNIYPGGDVNIMAVCFNMDIIPFGLVTSAKAYYAANSSLFSNVKGFYFVRGERRKTLECQGLMMNGCINQLTHPTAPQNAHARVTVKCSRNYGGGHPTWQVNQPVVVGANTVYSQQLTTPYLMTFTPANFWGFSENGALAGPYDEEEYYNSQHMIPLYRGYMPMVYKDGTWGINYTYVNRWFLRNNFYGFFSPDIMLSYPAKEFDMKYMRRVGKTLYNGLWQTDPLPAGLVQYPTLDLWSHRASFPTAESPLNNIYPIHLLAEMGALNMLTFPNRSSDDFKYKKIGDVEFKTRENSENWINRAGDYTSEETRLFYANYDNGAPAVEEWSNRPILIPPYVAIELNDALDESAPEYDNWNLDIVNFYNTDIDSITPTQIANYFGLTTQYHRISNLKTLAQIGTHSATEKYYNGDCFLQRTYFKHTWWTNDGALDETEWLTNPGSFYTHGITLSIVTENAINTAMRNHNDTHEYYPHEIEHIGWIKKQYNDKYSESYQMNNGYNRTLSPKFYYRYDENIPEVLNYDTRIYYSEQHIENSIRNYLRDIKIGNYKDFSKTNGPIIALFDVMGWLISVQRDCINQHYINEKQYQLSDEAIAIGTGLVLPANVKQLAEFGSEHRFGCYEKYGVDVKRRVIWRVGLASSDARGMYPVAENLTLMTMNQKWIYDYLETYFPLTDILLTLPDNPIYLGGIHIGIDAKYRDVLFTFVIPQTSRMYKEGVVPDEFLFFDCTAAECVALFDFLMIFGNNIIGYTIYLSPTEKGAFTQYTLDPAGFLYDPVMQRARVTLTEDIFFDSGDYYFMYGTYNKKTFVFNEDINWFTGNYPFTPNMYFTLNKEFFSYIRDFNAVPDEVYRHNINNVFLRFYGTVAEAYLTPVINGQHFLDKVFDHVVVECSDQLFLEIDYRTRTQTSSHTPFERRQTGTRPWIDAMYKEDKFYFPVMPELVSGTRYRQMRGPWMTIKLRFQQNIAFFIKNLLTYFRKSES